MPVVEIADWRPLVEAPRDGTSILLAVSPHAIYGRSGFVCIGRWVVPSDEARAVLGKKRRQRVEQSGGWWAAGKGNHPFSSPVWAWMPIPDFDFNAHREFLESCDHG